MDSGRLKALFIINPVLEKKKGVNVSGLVKQHLDHDRFSPTVIHSEYPGHAKDLAQQFAGKYPLIVAGGGDGTINEAGCSLVHSETVLGIIPLGSGNGLVRSLGIPMNIRNAINTINELNIISIDTGMAGSHRFFNIAGIGFSAEVAHAYSRSRIRGFFPYALNLVRLLPGYSFCSAKITLEDRTISGRFSDVSFANSSQWGYGAHISPLSKPDDGWLDICVLSTFPKILVPGLLVRLYLKSIYRSRYMESIPAKTAEISGEGPFKGHIDGDPVEFTTPFNISVEPVSLKVVSPRT